MYILFHGVSSPYRLSISSMPSLWTPRWRMAVSYFTTKHHCLHWFTGSPSLSVPHSLVLAVSQEASQITGLWQHWPAVSWKKFTNSSKLYLHVVVVSDPVHFPACVFLYVLCITSLIQPVLSGENVHVCLVSENNIEISNKYRIQGDTDNQIVHKHSSYQNSCNMVQTIKQVVKS